MQKGKNIGKNVLEYTKNKDYRKCLSDLTTDSKTGGQQCQGILLDRDSKIA